MEIVIGLTWELVQTIGWFLGTVSVEGRLANEFSTSIPGNWTGNVVNTRNKGPQEEK